MAKTRFGIVDFALLIAFSAIVLLAIFPLFWMLATSFKSPAEISAIPPSVLPRQYFFGNFLKIFKDKFFPQFFINSMVISTAVTALSVSGSALMGFVFAKYRFPFRNLVFYLILATIMIPFEAYIVPLYSLVRGMKMMNSYAGMIFPSVISSFGIFFMKQNMESLPDALFEAARIDGAGNYRTFFTVALPLSSSPISVLAILLFLIEWSNYLWPLLIATKKNMYVLEIGLTLLQDEYFIDYGVMMAGCTVALIPALILFILFRRNIMEGIAMTGIKG